MAKFISTENFPSDSVCSGQHHATHLILTCPDYSSFSDGTLRILETPTPDSNSCLHLLELHTAAMCRLTFGVFLFRFLAAAIILFSIYFISGALYRRFRRGAKGLNQIPHLGFWSRLGNKLADKCEDLCRCTAPPDDLEGETERVDQPILPM